MNKFYTQHSGRAVDTDGVFKHVMAIALDPRAEYKKGVIRCIVSREGDVEVSGYVDRSEIHYLSGDSLENFNIGSQVNIAESEKIISELSIVVDGKTLDFIGLEDPDIFVDDGTGLTHLYFTMPFLNKEKKHALVHLGHAVGNDIKSLRMTMPVVIADHKNYEGAKELSIAPKNKNGIRYNLIESSKQEKDFNYSVVRIAVAKDMGASWKFGDIVFHPKEHGISWIGGHASPGPLFSRDFFDVGEGKRLGIMNGREANLRVSDGNCGEEVKYGIFSVGLFIYDYENGKIDWVSPEPLIRDSEAKTITFASQFIETGKGEGVLYAHVDDSFVRAYTLRAEDLRSLGVKI